MGTPILDLIFGVRTPLQQTIHQALRLIDLCAIANDLETQDDTYLILSWLERTLPYLNSCLLRCKNVNGRLFEPHLSAFKMDSHAAIYRLNMVLNQLESNCKGITYEISREGVRSPPPASFRMYDEESLAVAVFKGVVQMLHRVKEIVRKEDMNSGVGLRKVLVCGGREDIEGLGLPLCDELRKRGLGPYLQGFEVGKENETGGALNDAWVGIFILSREFVEGANTMQCLTNFQERQNMTAARQIASPILMPVFYMLGEQECGKWLKPSALDKNSDTEEGSGKKVRQCAWFLKNAIGVENREGACNGDGELSAQKIFRLVESIADKVEEYCGN